MNHSKNVITLVHHHWRFFGLSTLLMLGFCYLVAFPPFPLSLEVIWVLSLSSALLGVMHIWVLTAFILFFLKQIPFLQNRRLITLISTTVGLAYNSFYVLFSFYSAYQFQSLWYLMYGFYFLIFAVTSYIIRKAFLSNKNDQEWKIYRITGYFIILAAIIFQAMIITVALRADSLNPTNPMFVYVMALTTFINVITSVVNIIRFRKEQSLLLRTTKSFHFSRSLFSLFFLQTIMFRTFMEVPSHQLLLIMTILLGGFVLIILSVLGTYMIHRSKHFQQ